MMLLYWAISLAVAIALDARHKTYYTYAVSAALVLVVFLKAVFSL